MNIHKKVSVLFMTNVKILNAIHFNIGILFYMNIILQMKCETEVEHSVISQLN